jgi:hypothetical protein
MTKQTSSASEHDDPRPTVTWINVDSNKNLDHSLLRRTECERANRSECPWLFHHAPNPKPDAQPGLQEPPMKCTRAWSQALLVLLLGLVAWPALAEDDCDAPLKRWQSRDAVRQMAAAQGWQIERLKIDDGCYEMRFTDAQGRRFKAKIDPETLKVLKLKPDEHKNEHQSEHKRERQSERQGEDPGVAQQVRPLPSTNFKGIPP